MVHPTALAYLRRRSNYLRTTLLRNDFLSDMSDRFVPFFVLFEWLKTPASCTSSAVAFHLETFDRTPHLMFMCRSLCSSNSNWRTKQAELFYAVEWWLVVPTFHPRARLLYSTSTFIDCTRPVSLCCRNSLIRSFVMLLSGIALHHAEVHQL
ncbi:hypothetical protein BDR05DRAFT_476839 [Suillus weaverae]|nr:hypothetical protein BDR05DRAFT_476839 [Suillus weaverae]